jgi:uncharacterized protein
VAVAVKKRYRVDLAADLAECEANYLRLQRLLPGNQFPGQAWDRHTFEVGANLQLHIEVTERSPYTTTLEISQPPTAIPTVAPRLTVRVYHDARLAEVVAFTSRRRILPRYDYPNSAMYQPWNRFLGEWLSHCLQHGFPLDRPVAYCLD